MPNVALGEIVDFVEGQFAGDRGRKITGVAPLAEAERGQLTFLNNRKYVTELAQTKADAILVPKNLEGESERWVRVDNPYLAMARVMAQWFTNRPKLKGLSEKASVASSASLGANVAIGPFVTIGENVVIGQGVTIFQNVSIEAGSVISDDTILYPNVVVYDGTRIGKRCVIHAGVIIGADGYGFVMHDGRHHKIPQIGIVRIEDDVEIGAGTTIDRAAFGETVIGEGTKIDNLVQVGHNVRIGKHCLLVSQFGIAGSSELGDYVAAGGQSGVSGHIKIGNYVQIAGGAKVFESVPDGGKVMGSPAMPFNEFARGHAALRRLARKKKT